MEKYAPSGGAPRKRATARAFFHCHFISIVCADFFRFTGPISSHPDKSLPASASSSVEQLPDVFFFAVVWSQDIFFAHFPFIPPSSHSFRYHPLNTGLLPHAFFFRHLTPLFISAILSIRLMSLLTGSLYQLRAIHFQGFTGTGAL